MWMQQHWPLQVCDDPVQGVMHANLTTLLAFLSPRYAPTRTCIVVVHVLLLLHGSRCRRPTNRAPTYTPVRNKHWVALCPQLNQHRARLVLL